MSLFGSATASIMYSEKAHAADFRLWDGWVGVVDGRTMRAIEVTGRVNSQGDLQLDCPLSDAADQRVRAIVLLADSDGDITERTWREADAKNPSFAFLQDEAEDIYTLNDGQPISDEG